MKFLRRRPSSVGAADTFSCKGRRDLTLQHQRGDRQSAAAGIDQEQGADGRPIAGQAAVDGQALTAQMLLAALLQGAEAAALSDDPRAAVDRVKQDLLVLLRAFRV